MSLSGRQAFTIVGGGVAAAEGARTLRADGFDGRLTIVTAEPYLPYERPPLSKAYLRGEVRTDTLLAQPASFYEDEGIDVRVGRRAVGLDLSERRLTLDDDSSVRFDRLLLATGSRATRPPIAGSRRPWVHLLRTMDDSDALRADALSATSAVVAGGGWIAAETAASLRQMGLDVTLVVPGDEVLERHLGPEVGRTLTELHRGHGVRVVPRSRVVEIVDGREGRGVRLEGGAVLAGDLVVLGFGATPVVELAVDAGLAVGDGVLVDEHLMTAAEGVFAAGDVASAWHPRHARRVRSQHWDGARRQARTAARNMLGRTEAYDRVPYFFSDQYELGLEALGRHGHGDEVLVRAQDGGLIALWLRAGLVVAGMHADLWGAKKEIDRLVSTAARIDRLAFRDASVPLAEVALLDAAQTALKG
jgi:3-phenylpropionate/trans-cinnamate dioxygenase ferredoxin reductase subunit